MNAYDYTLFHYAYLQEGESENSDACPKCGGGANEDRAFDITRKDGRLLWICRRASCGFRGSSGGSRSSSAMLTESPDTRGTWGRTIIRQTGSVPIPIRKELGQRYGITSDDARRAELCWDEKTKRLAMPVKNLSQETTGVMLRSLSGESPKVLSYVEKDSIAWYLNHTSDSLLVVEDQLSAVKASRYMSTVALLGTNINDSRVERLRSFRPDVLYLALDKDAFPLAVKYAKRFRDMLPIKLVTLDKDIKDTEDIEDLFNEINNL